MDTYYEHNKEKLLARQRAYRQTPQGKAKKREQYRRHYLKYGGTQEYKARARAKRKNQYANPEVRKRKLEYQRMMYSADPDKFRNRVAAWKQANR